MQGFHQHEQPGRQHQGPPRHHGPLQCRRPAPCEDSHEESRCGKGGVLDRQAGHQRRQQHQQRGRGHRQQGPVPGRADGPWPVPPPEVAPERQPQQDKGDQQTHHCRCPHQPGELHRAESQPLLGQQVGQVGDGQQQRGRIGQPDAGQGERQRRNSGMHGQEDHHRRHQHRGGVQGQEHRGYGGQRDHQQPQGKHPAPAQGCEPSGHGPEQPGLVHQFGDQGHGQDKAQDGHRASGQLTERRQREYACGQGCQACRQRGTGQQVTAGSLGPCELLHRLIVAPPAGWRVQEAVALYL